MLSFGVEEEFLLLEPDGAVAPAAAQVIRAAEGDGIVPEFMAYQVETVTGICTTLDQLRSELEGRRLLAARAAEQSGVRLVATGTPPLARGPLGALTDNSRYRELALRFPRAVAAGATCASHVHVGVPDRELAVDVVTRLRPWLSTLLALTANSPLTAGVDSGWSSTRYTKQLRWPTFRAPHCWTTAERYDHSLRSLVACGAAMDAASVYYLVRLSARYPTVEVRVTDTCLTADDAVLLAGIVRALVTALIADSHSGVWNPPVPGPRINAGLVAAARDGMSSRESRQGSGPAAAVNLAARLLAKIAPALEASGDGDVVRAGLDRVLRFGTGADHQRRMLTSADNPAMFVASLADATAPAVAAAGAVR